MSGPDAQNAPGSVQDPGYISSDTIRLAPAPDGLSPRSRAIRYFQQLLHMRRQREKRFGHEFTTDRGWDLLLMLMIARLEDRMTKGADVFHAENAHRISVDELDRQIRFGTVILIEAGDNLERSQIVLSDETARHMIDLFRIDTTPGGPR